MDRRRVLRGLAVGGTLAVLSRAARAVAAPKRRSEQPDDRGPYWLFSPLRAGAVIGSGWHLRALSSPHEGALVAALERGPKQAELHVCALGPGLQGIAQTGHFDLFLMNGADGTSQTDETLGSIVKYLGGLIAKAEARFPDRAATLSTQLLAHGEREPIIRAGRRG